MKITIRDISNTVSAPQSLRLAKPIIDLDTAPYAITLLRISLGLLFLAHGLLKVFTFTLPGTAQFFESIGLPGFMAYIVAPMQILGGVLLIAGLYTRWVALALFPILLVATFTHLSSGWLFTNEGGGWEFPAFFAIATLVQFLLGDGAYALSARFRARS
jgi:putative oxidoreductase